MKGRVFIIILLMVFVQGYITGQSFQMDMKMMNNRSYIHHNTPLVKTGYWQTWGWQATYMHHLKQFDLGLFFLKYRPKTFFSFEDKEKGIYSGWGDGSYEFLSPGVQISRKMNFTRWLYCRLNLGLHYTYRNLTWYETGSAYGGDSLITYTVSYLRKPDSWQFRPEAGLSLGWRFARRWHFVLSSSYVYGRDDYQTEDFTYTVASGDYKGTYANRVTSDGSAWTLSAGLKFDFSKYRIIITDELKYDDK